MADATPVDHRPVPQADGTSEPPHKPEKAPGAGDTHIGATEGQVGKVPAPAGKAFEDEPKQG